MPTPRGDRYRKMPTLISCTENYLDRNLFDEDSSSPAPFSAHLYI
ncbi:MAG: hypothetical protein QNJ34_12750 [Xenococcaceae cyanobacterium MO_188.B29]|nr:hypothetical protein [Xenococcaceae cyanobacterium MO_188.B29]